VEYASGSIVSHDDTSERRHSWPECPAPWSEAAEPEDGELDGDWYGMVWCPSYPLDRNRCFRLEMTRSRLVRPRAVYIGARAGLDGDWCR
jgi:hypothetical protein